MNLERTQVSRRAFLEGGALAGLAGLSAVLLGRRSAQGGPGPQAANAIPGARLQALLDEQTRNGVPGIILHVETADGSWWTGASGVQRLKGKPMTAETPFPVFSVAKLAMATAAFRLQEDGFLHFDDKISKWLDPAVARSLPHSQEVTVCGLVRQTSGFRDYFDESFIETLWADPTRVWAPEELVAIAAKGEPLGLPDDGDSDYSNTNYVLLGLVMQKASGMPLAAVLRRYVYSPLHMTQTASWEEATLRSNVAGYIPADDELIEVDSIDLSMSWGAGGMISTARDVARLMRGMLTGDVLSKADRDVVMNGFGRSRVARTSSTATRCRRRRSVAPRCWARPARLQATRRPATTSQPPATRTRC